VTRAGGTLLAGGSTVSLTIGNITNPATAQATTFFEVATESASGAWINSAFPPGVTIGCPATITKSSNHQRDVAFGGDVWGVGGGAYIAQLESSDFAVFDDFQIMMPAGATVAGIQFDVERRNTGWPVVDSAIRAVRNSSVGTVDEAATAQWPFSYQTQSYGGATDLWGQTWSAADIESSTFGAAIAARAVTSGMTGTVTVRNVSATVYLSCP
jgi:hypothetical protein